MTLPFLTVSLGDFTFEHTEVPESINGGGQQRYVMHELVGGIRIVDAMGESDSDISWTGLFQGIFAIERARALDTLRKQGNILPFTYSQYRYNAIIKSFEWTFLPASKIQYSITLGIVEDLTKPINFVIPSGFDDVLTEALEELLDLEADIPNPALKAAIAAVQNAINSVGSFETANQGEINATVNVINNAINTVNGLIP